MFTKKRPTPCFRHGSDHGCRPSGLCFNGGYNCGPGGYKPQPNGWWANVASTLGQGVAAGLATGAVSFAGSRLLRRRKASTATAITTTNTGAASSSNVAALQENFGLTEAQAVAFLNSPEFVRSLIDFRSANLSSGTGGKLAAAAAVVDDDEEEEGGAARKQTAADTIVHPFVFDKILSLNAGFETIPVAQESSLEEFIRCANTNNVLTGNAAVNAVYNPNSARKFVDLHGRWTSPGFGESPGLRKRIRPDLITSRQMAWEMLIVYVRSLTRDIEFDGWESNATVVALTDSMNAVLQAFPGEINPRMVVDPSTGLISPRNLLRGVYVGEGEGHFWNQLQMFPTFTGLSNCPEPRIYYPEKDAETQVTSAGYLNQQTGVTGFAKRLDVGSGPRVIARPRDIIGFVHSDVLEVAFRQSIDILLRTELVRQCVFDGKNPTLQAGTAIFYSETGCGFMKGFLHNVIRSALTAAWNFKYSFFRIRPERLAYYWDLLSKDPADTSVTLTAAEAALRSQLLPLMQDHVEVINSAGGTAILDQVRAQNSAAIAGSEPLLLLGVFPEGSPTHCSYVGGHSVASGAMATALKMFFQMYANPLDDADASLVSWSSIISGVYGDSFSNATLAEVFTDAEGLAKYYTAEANDIRFPLKGDAATNTYVRDTSAEASQATVLGEIHKLASQYTFSRDWSGVHYQSDGYVGMFVGQSVSIRYMQATIAGLPSQSVPSLDNRVIFPTFDGVKVRIGATTLERYDTASGSWVSVETPEELYPSELQGARIVQEDNVSL